MRGFEKISIEEYIKKRKEEEFCNVKIPARSTKNSAGYDFYLPYEVKLKAKDSTIISTGIKAFMESDEFLMIVIRSSLGFKKGLRLKNQVGIIDSDYYNNIDNEGHILLAIENTSPNDIILNAGDRIAQGIFLKYLTCDNEEEIKNSRDGGIGSTNV